MIRPVVAASLAALLAACSQGGASTEKSSDPYAGLSAEILTWRKAIEATHTACANKVDGKGCQDFQVMCKAQHIVSAEDAAKGVTAQVVAAMTFAGRNTDGSTGKSGSSFALFSKSQDGWDRAEAMPVNLSTCAEL